MDVHSISHEAGLIGHVVSILELRAAQVSMLHCLKPGTTLDELAGTLSQC